MSMQRCGIAAIHAALDTGEEVTRVLALRDSEDPELLALLQRCVAAGIDVIRGSENDLWRMSADGPQLALALVGREPTGSLEEMLSRGGLLWMLAGAKYQTNIGYCIRMAEASGADGLIVTGDWNSEDRHRIVRAAMKTHRFMPVHFGGEALEIVGRWPGRTLSIEDCGNVEPWEADLAGDILLVVGGENEGIPPEILAASDQILRIPMAGFTPSYNLQAPMAVVAVEALRQRRGE